MIPIRVVGAPGGRVPPRCVECALRSKPDVVGVSVTGVQFAKVRVLDAVLAALTSYTPVGIVGITA